MTEAPPKELNNFDYGFESNHWLLKVALAYVPQKQLHFAICALLDKWVYGVGDEGIHFETAADILAQAAFTGRYVPTSEDVPSYLDSYPDDTKTSGVHATVDTAEPVLTEGDAQAFVDWLASIPTAEDPHDINKEETPS